MGGKSSQSTQTVQIPPEVLARYNAVNSRAENVAATPFQAYSSDPSAFVQQLTNTQRTGISQISNATGTADPYFRQAGTYGRGAGDIVSNTAGMADPYFQQATGYGLQAGENINAADPYMQQAAMYGLNAGQNVNPQALTSDQINQYMNPYMQTVLGSTQAMLNQQNQQAMAGQTGNAIRSGAFGGDRAGIAAANLQQQQNLAAGKIYSDIASQGYNQALATAQQQQGLGYQADAANRAAQLAASQNMAGLGQGQLGIAQARLAASQNMANLGMNQQQTELQRAQAMEGVSQNLANLGVGQQQAALQGAQALLGAGQLEQQTGQAGKTALYNQFMQQQSYPFQVAQFLANIAMGTGALSGSTTTTTQPGGFFSDERLKEDIKEIGKTFDGQPIYKYRYKGDDKHQIGLIAQDVEKHHPHAVGLAGGYKTVDYDKATEDAEHKGHFASGGLASMGGHVSPEHMGEGFAYGGAPIPEGMSSTDLAALLESQAKMFGPFSSYALDTSGAPHSGGLAGYVPQTTLPVGNLVTAPGLEPQDSALSDAAEASKSIGDIYSGYKAAKNEYETYQDKKEKELREKFRDDVLPGENSRGGLIGYSDGGSAPDEYKPKEVEPAKSDLSGLAASAASNIKAPNEGQTKMDIPNEQKAPQLNAPKGADATDPTGRDLASLASIGASIAMMMSDKRLKEDVHPIGKTFDGQTVYKYRYKGEPHFRMGLIAQEVEKHHPHAVGLAGGYKTVNYDKATEDAEHRGHFFQGGLPNVSPLAGGMPMALPLTSTYENRTGLSAGGMPYQTDAENGAGSIPKLDIPTQQMGGTPQLQKPDQLSKQPTGLQNAGDLASLGLAGMGIKDALTKKGAEAGLASAAGAAPAAAVGTEAAGAGMLGAALPVGLAGLALGSLFRKDGGAANRHGYAEDGAVVEDPYKDKSDWAANSRESIPLIGDVWKYLREDAQKRQAEKEATSQANAQRDADINRQLTFDTPEGKYSAGSEGQLMYQQPLTAEQEDINKGLTFAPTEQGGKRFTIDESGKRTYVPDSYRPPVSGLASAETGTSAPSQNAASRTSASTTPTNTLKDRGLMSDPSPIAEALGDVSQMPTTTQEGATGAGGLSPENAPAVAPVSTTETPKAGLAAAPSTGTKAAGLAAKTEEGKTDDGKPAHWYTDPKYIIPLLQGVAAMGTAPTRSWGVALSAGLGQGLKGYQQQRAFELEQQKTGADVGLTKAMTLQTKVDSLAAAAKARRENIFDVYGEKWVNIEGGKTMRYSDWRNMPNPPPLEFTSLTTGIEMGTDMPLATAPAKTVIKPTATAATSVSQSSGRISPSEESLSLINQNADANFSSGAKEKISENTVDVRNKLAERASTAYAQEPQLTAMASAVSKIPANTLLQENTISDFTQSVLLNWNSLVGAIGHPELQVKKDELTDIAIKEKAAAAYQLGIGKNSVEALQTAAATIPTNKLTKDAAIAITANMLIDKQRAIDEALYENDIYNRVSNRIGYNAFQSTIQFGRDSSAIYEEEKNKLIKLLGATTPDGESIVSLLQSGRTTPEQVDAYMKSPGISRYFMSGRR